MRSAVAKELPPNFITIRLFFLGGSTTATLPSDDVVAAERCLVRCEDEEEVVEEEEEQEEEEEEGVMEVEEDWGSERGEVERSLPLLQEEADGLGREAA